MACAVFQLVWPQRSVCEEHFLKFSILETSLGKRPSSACGLTQAQTEAPAIFPYDIFLISGLLLKAFT